MFMKGYRSRELKRSLKDPYEHDRDRYTAAKGDFIREVTRMAREEFEGKYVP